jgi:hypothetical protein
MKELSAVDNQLQVFKLLSTWEELRYTTEDFENIIDPIIKVIVGDEPKGSVNPKARGLRDYYLSMWLTAKIIGEKHSHTQDDKEINEEKSDDIEKMKKNPCIRENSDERISILHNTIKKLSFKISSYINYKNDIEILRELKCYNIREFEDMLEAVYRYDIMPITSEHNSTIISYYCNMWEHEVEIQREKFR